MSIHAGYERAFVTIVDANVTTLIVTIVLFSLGSGAVKNFAVNRDDWFIDIDVYRNYRHTRDS